MNFPGKEMLAVVIIISVLTPVRTSDDVISTVLEPSGSVYNAVAEELELVCSYRGDTTDNSSERLSIERCRDRKCFTVPSEIVNGTSIRASIQSLRLNDTGTYTCNFLPDPVGMSILFLRVGYRPSPPKDIYCFSKDHLDMNCTVTLADRDAMSELGHNVTIDFQSDRSTDWLKCLHYDARYLSCYWKSPADSDSSGMDFLSDFSLLDGYRVRVRVMNILGMSQAIRTISDTTTIVTISKLHQFGVTNITSRKATLSWVLPEYILPGAFVIDFVVNYSSRWDQRQLMYSSKNQMRTQLKGLIPYTNYHVTIRARGRLVTDNRSWSPVERLSFRTDKDAPGAAPRSTVGGYFLPRRGINNTDIKCALHIYTKPIPKRKRNGNLSEMYYSVSVEGETDQLLQARPHTTLTLRDKSCWNDRPHNITVQACTDVRLCSNKRTVIHIPSFDQHLNTGFPYATEVIAEGFGDTSLKVSWFIKPQLKTLVKEVTVFWCRGNRELHVCKNDLSWTKLPGNATETLVNLSLTYRHWMFAVSLTTQNGESGGMVFDECQFLYENTEQEHKDAVQGNPDTLFVSVKPTFNLLARGGDVKSIDVVSLTFRYCDLYRKPDQYEIFYKTTTEETEEDCTNGARALHVTATLRVHEIVLPNLDPMSQYSVCMRIRTSVGISELSDVSLRKALKFPDDSGLEYASIISITLASALFLTSLISITWCVRRKYKSMDVNVQVPAIETYCSADQRLVESRSLLQRLQDKCIVNDGDSGITSKENTTQTTSSKGNKSFVKTRRPLPVPPLLTASRRASTDSYVMRSSLGSQATDGSKEKSFRTTLNDVTVKLPSKQPCEICMIDILEKCRSHGTENIDIPVTDNSGSIGDYSAGRQPGFTQNSSAVISGASASRHEPRSTDKNPMTGVGDYCQWDVLSCRSNDAVDLRLASPCSRTEHDTTDNSGVSERTGDCQKGRTSANSDVNYNRANADRDNDISSSTPASFQNQSMPEGVGELCKIVDEHSVSFPDDHNPLLLMDSPCVDNTIRGTVSNRPVGNYRPQLDIGSSVTWTADAT